MLHCAVAVALFAISEPTSPVLEGPSFDKCCARATHNSYSGGKRGSIPAQLDSGIRFIELDIHDTNFVSEHDYSIGHSRPGDEVQRGDGNPDDVHLRSWLGCIKSWSDSHKDHFPVVIALDIKGGGTRPQRYRNGLAGNPSFADGNLTALNHILKSVLGEQIYSNEGFSGKWPAAESLRGRFIIMLSGDLSSREGYRWDQGEHPCVAINSHGAVVELHESGTSNPALCYWTGELIENGSVRWHRTGRFDQGRNPSVFINDKNEIVAACETGDGQHISTRFGSLGSDYEVTWKPRLADATAVEGHMPSLTVAHDSSMDVTLQYRSFGDESAIERTGRISPADGTITWSLPAPSQGVAAKRNMSEQGAKSVTVHSALDEKTGARVLQYSVSSGASGRIRCEQIAFAEHQMGEEPSLLRDNAEFCATRDSAKGKAWVAGRRAEGRITRLWAFDSMPGLPLPEVAPENFAATDDPSAQWYRDYALKVHAAD
jgi:hypothetical protein